MPQPKKPTAKSSPKDEGKSKRVRKFEKTMDGAKSLGSLLLTAFDTGKRLVKDANDLISGDASDEDNNGED